MRRHPATRARRGHRRVAAAETVELERRERLYRGDRPAVDVVGRVVILVDDGVATGSTMRAAVVSLSSRHPSRVVVAASPPGSEAAVMTLGDVATEVVCLTMPEPFYAVGMSYADFSEVGDDDVRALLAASIGVPGRVGSSRPRPVTDLLGHAGSNRIAEHVGARGVEMSLVSDHP